jgi:uncharacterized protein YwqG
MNLDVIKQKLANHRRSAFTPVTVEGELGPDQSKFGGVAWINEGEAWPVCGYCGKPLQLFLQLDLSGLPMTLPGWPAQGFVQVFYCTTSKTYCDQCGDDAFSPFGQFLCARLLERTGGCKFTDTTPVDNPLPVKSITGWRKMDDYPAPAELDALAPGLTTDEEAGYLFDVIEQSDAGSAGESPTTIRGDKLGGWPMWLQNPHNPTCPECASVMEYVVQISSNGNLDYMFGDCGIAHLHRCSKHPRVLGFSWAGS